MLSRCAQPLCVSRVVVIWCSRSRQAVPLSAYEAAVKALDGPDCSVALELAREVRSKLGDSTEVRLNEKEPATVGCIRNHTGAIQEHFCVERKISHRCGIV